MTAAPWMRMPSERLASAFQKGDAARDQHRIRPVAHMLYEHLVRFAGERDWCWPGEARLATQMDCSVSTIKRLLRELVKAGLIARARRLNRSSLTYITAYTSAHSCTSDIDITSDSEISSVPHASPAGDETAESSDIPSVLNHAHETETLFFGTNAEPSVGPETNQVIDMKNQHPEGLVDGGDFSSGDTSMLDQSADETTTVQVLRTAGVVDPGVLAELAHQPLTRVERAMRSVERIRRADDPRKPGLLVHLLRKTRHNEKEDQRHQVCDGYRSSQPSVDIQEQTITPSPSERCVTELAVLWQKVLAQVESEVPSDEFRTWLQSTSLLEVETSVAVVETPNVFVRDVVLERYAPMISHALASETGCLVELVVVIG